MSHYASKQTYNRLMTEMGQSPAPPQMGGFTQYQHGSTLVGFKPYRGHDVSGRVHVLLDRFGPVWASLDGDEHVTLFGWGATDANLSDFAPEEQARLIAHKATRALDGVPRKTKQIACCPVCSKELGEIDFPAPFSSEQARAQQEAFPARCEVHPRGWTTKTIWL